MRYCPNCGAEYHDHIEICADCHVPLVEDPPEPAEPEVGLLVRLTPMKLLRAVFVALVVVASVYAISAVASAIIFTTTEDTTTRGFFDLATTLSEVQTAALRVGIALIGVLGGATLIRRFDDRSVAHSTPASPSAATRVLFWLFVLFTVIWTVTGVMSSELQVENTYRPAVAFPEDDAGPSDFDITVAMVEYASYVVAASSFAVLVGLYVLNSIGTRSSDSERPKEELG